VDRKWISCVVSSRRRRPDPASILYGSAGGISVAGNLSLQQDFGTILDAVASFDQFGFSVAVADFNGDGFGDVAIGAPDESLSPGPFAQDVTC
jgi:hypothetical protein